MHVKFYKVRSWYFFSCFFAKFISTPRNSNCTMCPRSFDPLYIVSSYIEYTTCWTYCNGFCFQKSCKFPFIQNTCFYSTFCLLWLRVSLRVSSENHLYMCPPVINILYLLGGVDNVCEHQQRAGELHPLHHDPRLRRHLLQDCRFRGSCWTMKMKDKVGRKKV